MPAARRQSRKGPVVRKIAFQAGDVILSSGHSMMWVGGDRAIVHNAGGIGVLRELGAELLAPAKSATKFAVFRFDNAEVAARAAEYAIDWAVEGNAEIHPTIKSPYDLSNKTYTVTGKSELSSGRYEYASALQSAKQTDWTVESLYRVVKAVARKYHRLGLSPLHGVTCAQFVTYCYQAAFLEKKFGHIINSTMLELMCKDGVSTKYFKLHAGEKDNPVMAALADIKSTDLPLGLRVEPKSILVGLLREKMEEKDSGFRSAGYMVHKGGGELILWEPTDGEKPEEVALDAVLKL